MASTYVSIDSTGQVAWLTAANFISQCIVDIKYYPFDAQECHMIVSLIVKRNATTTGNKNNNSTDNNSIFINVKNQDMPYL